MANLDAAKAEALGGRTLSLVNDAFLGMMVSIGSQTDLFEVMAGVEGATSESIAPRARLNERYVCEFLSAMVAGKLVEYDAATKMFRLPPEHAACLVRAAGPDNLASFARYLLLAAGVARRG
jgi:DNA-binding IclR family transcriptional regulator